MASEIIIINQILGKYGTGKMLFYQIKLYFILHTK